MHNSILFFCFCYYFCFYSVRKIPVLINHSYVLIMGKYRHHLSLDATIIVLRTRKIKIITNIVCVCVCMGVCGRCRDRMNVKEKPMAHTNYKKERRKNKLYLEGITFVA